MKLSTPLQYKNNKLYFDNIALEKIAENIPTPFYLYSEQSIKNNYQNFYQAALKYRLPSPLICYALKANPNPYLLSSLAVMGAGADIVSGGELTRALECSIPSNRIIFSGVGKTRQEIQQALYNQIFSFNIESVDELNVINNMAKESGITARVTYRLNPEVHAKTHKNISTGSKYHKFGITKDEILLLHKRQSSWPSVQLVGISMHIGSQLSEMKASLKAIQILSKLVLSLNQKLEFIDLGGGLGIPYTMEEKNKYPTPDQYMKAVSNELEESLFNSIKPEYAPSSIIFEPGRVISATAGVLVTRVIRTKQTSGHHFTIIDAGLNDFMRPSLYGASHQLLPAEKKAGRKITTNVVGPVCETTDQFASNLIIQNLKSDDLLVIKDAGAYGQIMSSNYNLRRKPPEIIISTKGEIIH